MSFNSLGQCDARNEIPAPRFCGIPDGYARCPGQVVTILVFHDLLLNRCRC